MKTRKEIHEPLNVSDSENDQQLCFFCKKAITRKDRKASTLGLDTSVKRIAHKLGDRRMLAKLSEADMVAIDAVYIIFPA